MTPVDAEQLVDPDSRLVQIISVQIGPGAGGECVRMGIGVNLVVQRVKIEVAVADVERWYVDHYLGSLLTV